MIKPADMNLGLIIMRVDAYHAVVQQHVGDTSTYKDVSDSLGRVIQSACQLSQYLVGICKHELGDILS